MIDEFETIGQCDNCDGRFPLQRFQSHWYCKFCMPYKKEGTKSKVDAIEKPIDDFSKLIRKTGQTGG